MSSRPVTRYCHCSPGRSRWLNRDLLVVFNVRVYDSPTTIDCCFNRASFPRLWLREKQGCSFSSGSTETIYINNAVEVGTFLSTSWKINLSLQHPTSGINYFARLVNRQSTTRFKNRQFVTKIRPCAVDLNHEYTWKYYLSLSNINLQCNNLTNPRNEAFKRRKC